MKKRQAVLLLGPTSSGKTPLGDYLAENGIAGRRFAHFDFGAKFRAAADSAVAVPPLVSEDIEVIRHSIATGALLTDEQFHIAQKLLSAFINESESDEMVLLNGMPRHTGQAEGVAEIAEVVCVVQLLCDRETVIERIRCDTGGDRAGRADDLPALVDRKLEIYEKQTRPLVDFYKNKTVPVLTTTVTVISQAPDVAGEIEPAFRRLEMK